MLNVSIDRKFLKPLLFASAIGGMALLSSCGGSLVGGNFSAEIVYMATGTKIVQYAVTSNGTLTPLTTASFDLNGASDVAIARSGNYGYVVANGQAIYQYSIPASGQLTALTTANVATTATDMTSVAVSPDDKFVFAQSRNGGVIESYSVGTGGALTAVASGSVATATDGDGMVLTPDGKFLYATGYGSNAVSAYSIGTDGILTPLSTPTYTVNSPSRPTVSADGKFLYVPASIDGIAQFAINADGSLTPLSPATVAGPAAGNDTFALSPNGKFGYVGSFNGGFAGSPVGQYSVATDGTLSPLSPASVAAGNAPASIAIEPGGRYLYVANTNDGTVSQFSIGADGTLAPLSTATVDTSGAGRMVILAR